MKPTCGSQSSLCCANFEPTLVLSTTIGPSSGGIHEFDVIQVVGVLWLNEAEGVVIDVVGVLWLSKKEDEDGVKFRGSPPFAGNSTRQSCKSY